MIKRATSGVLLAGLLTAAIATAPASQARPTCQETATQTTCQTNGSVSIKVQPGTTAPPADQPVFPWLGVPGAD